MNSRNGVKVNNVRIEAQKRVDPGDVISIAKHRFELRYFPADLGAIGPPPDDDGQEAVFSKSLLERAGLTKKKSIEEMAEEDEIHVRRAEKARKKKPGME
jgi:hypothetical protein